MRLMQKHVKELGIMIGIPMKEIRCRNWRKDSTGKIVFYDGLDENLIKEKYPPIHYKIIWANENYAALHEGKEAGKVYAISTHPNIKKEELSEKKFVLGGVPTLVEFENHKVINFYFDDKEIIDFLESDTQPLDKYWNLE